MSVQIKLIVQTIVHSTSASEKQKESNGFENALMKVRVHVDHRRGVRRFVLSFSNEFIAGSPV